MGLQNSFKNIMLKLNIQITKIISQLLDSDPES